MSASVNIVIRPPPHTDFVRGYPGIPASPDGARPSACIQGTVEVRPKPKGVKAIWLRLELRKLEQIPGNKATSRYREHIGSGPITLWQARSKGKKAADAQYEVLMNSDWPFSLPLPEGLPPSVLVDSKNGLGVHYELTATMLVKPKSGLLSSGGKDPVPVNSSVSIIVEKQELIPSWPIYAYRAQVEDRRERLNKLNMSVKRQSTAYGPGDAILVTMKLRSERPDHVKLARIELTLREVITFRGDIKDPNAAGDQRTTDIVEARQWVNKALFPNEDHTFHIRGVIPAQHARVSVSTAKHVIIAYSMGIRAVFDRERGTVGALSDLVIDHMPTTIGSYAMEQGGQVIAKIVSEGSSMPVDLSSPSPMPLRASVLGLAAPSSNGSDPGQTPSPQPPQPPFQLHQANGFAHSPPPFDTPPMAGTPSLPAFHSQNAHRPSPPHIDTAPMRNTYSSPPLTQAQPDEYGRTYARQSAALVGAAKQRLAEARAQQQSPALSAVEPSPLVVQQPAWESAEAEKKRLREQIRIENATDTNESGVVTTIEEQKRLLDQAQATSSSSSSSPQPKMGAWQTAAQEKRRLYEDAVRARGEEPEGEDGYIEDVPSPPLPDDTTRPTASPPLAPRSPPIVEVPPTPISAVSAAPTPTLNAFTPISASQSGNSVPNPAWPSAAEEKDRLYTNAIHARAGNKARIPSGSSAADEKDAEAKAEAGPPGYLTAGEEKERLYSRAIETRPTERQAFPHQLGSEQSAVDAYQNAIAERERWQASGSGSSSLPRPQPQPPTASSSSRPDSSTSAAIEKAALAARYRQEEAGSMPKDIVTAEEQRYRDAITLRDRVQAELNSPSPPASPPPQSGSAGPPTYDIDAAPKRMSEKEQMARFYAAQEEVAERQKQRSQSPRGSLANVAEDEAQPPSFSSLPNSSASSARSPPRASSATFTTALSEKEAMARYFAAQEQTGVTQTLPGAYVYTPVATPDLRTSSASPSQPSPSLPIEVNPLRRVSSANSSESGTVDEPRDPSIALGKRRADPTSPVASLPYASPPQSIGGWQSNRTSMYGYGLAPLPTSYEGAEGEDGHRAMSPPPRPPKTPLLNARGLR